MKMKLADISKKISKGSTPRGKVNYSKNENNYFLRVTDMVDLANVYNSEFTLSDEDINNNKMKIWPINTVLVSIEGTVGKISILKKEMSFNQAVAGIIPNEEIINPRYLMYYLRTTPVFSGILKGTIMPALRLEDLSEIEIEVPDMEIQNKMVSIVDSITNKIDLNNKTNNNLYELMKIKFNDYIETLDEYEESVLSKIANYKNGLAMQNYRPVNENGLPVIKIKEMNSGITSETERCSSDIDEEVIINDGDVLFAWSGTLCMSIWCGGKAGLNQHIFKVTSNKYPKWFYYFWTLKHLDNFIEIAAGKATTMGHIKRTELDKALVKIPSDKSINEMNNIFEPMLNKYINTNIENRNLSMLRDTLLPKLMNGKIDLDNIEV
jgi:type I restriction enzyme S subunit